MTNSVQVTRFSFTGGRAKPIKQELVITGVNRYDERQILFAVQRDEEKTSHVMSLSLDSVKVFAELFKAAVAEAKVAEDTTPAEWRAKHPKQDVKQAPQDVNAILEALKAAGYSITPPQAPKEAEKPAVAPEKPKERITRKSTHTKPAEAAPKAVPALDDLDEIATSDLEAVSSILSILLGKRGTK